MLVSISEDGEYHDSPTITRQNTNLRRDSFGNQSFKTGLDELANSYGTIGNNIINGLSSPRSTPLTSTIGYHHDHCVSSTGWGFYINE